MHKNENSRPAGGTAGAGQRGAGQDRADRVPVSNSITSGPPRQRVFPLLGHGKENAVPGHELAALLGLSDLRELTRIVERERAAGIPICATCDSQQPGYYLACEPSELAAYIKSLDRRLYNVRKTRDRLADALERITGQTALWK